MPVSGNDKEEAQRQEKSRGEWRRGESRGEWRRGDTERRRGDTERRRGDTVRSPLHSLCFVALFLDRLENRGKS